jgi:hypothetical protein
MSGEINKASAIGTGANKKHSAINPGTIKAFIVLIVLAMLVSLLMPTINSAMEKANTVSSVQSEDPAQVPVTTTDSKVKEYVAKAVGSEYPPSKVEKGHFVSKFSTEYNYEAVIIGVFDPEKVPLKVSSERGDQVEFSKIEDGYLYFTVMASEKFPMGLMTISFKEKGGDSGTTISYFPEIEEKIRIPPKTEEVFVKISYPISR